MTWPYTMVTNYGTVDWFSGTCAAGATVAPPLTTMGCGMRRATRLSTPLWLQQRGVQQLRHFRKSGGDETNRRHCTWNQYGGVYFNQLAGVVDVQNGVNGLNLVLQGSGSFTGGYITTNTAGVTCFSSGSFNLNGTVTPTNLIENAGNFGGRQCHQRRVDVAGGGVELRGRL